jgi:cysteine desulfurase
MPYLDYAASAPLRPEALAAMLPLLERPAANPSSQHGQGRAARAAVETAREQVAALVGAAPGEVVFTSGGTEADNLAVKGTVLARAPEARHLVCSAVEHHAVLDAAAWAEADAAARVDLAPVDHLGRVDPDRLAALLQPGRTALVALMAANNEVGTGQPVAAVAELAHAAGAVLLCDAVQAAGLPGVDMAADGIDLLALASHKLGGPTGVGALVVRSGTTLRPLVHGGGQERGLRSGTLPAAALAGFGAAAAAALADRHTGATTLATLRSRLLTALRALAPDLEVNGHPGPGAGGAPDLEVNGDRDLVAGGPLGEGMGGAPSGSPGGRPGLPGLLSVRFPGRRAEDLLLLLDRHGIACSAGSACASGAVTPSHVLVAMGREPAAARETVRFSLGHASTQADVDAAVAAVARALEVLAPPGRPLDRRSGPPARPEERPAVDRRAAPAGPGPGPAADRRAAPAEEADRPAPGQRGAPVPRGPESRGSESLEPESGGSGSLGPESRGSESRGPESRGSGSRGPVAQGVER